MHWREIYPDGWKHRSYLFGTATQGHSPPRKPANIAQPPKYKISFMKMLHNLQNIRYLSWKCCAQPVQERHTSPCKTWGRCCLPPHTCQDSVLGKEQLFGGRSSLVNSVGFSFLTSFVLFFLKIKLKITKIKRGAGLGFFYHRQVI